MRRQTARTGRKLIAQLLGCSEVVLLLRQPPLDQEAAALVRVLSGQPLRHLRGMIVVAMGKVVRKEQVEYRRIIRPDPVRGNQVRIGLLRVATRAQFQLIHL